MKVLFIGTGLIGGSFSLALKEKGLISLSGGFSRRESTLEKARHLGIIDIKFTNLSEGIRWADWIILSIPVDAIVSMLPGILNNISEDQVVVDFGSTKSSICSAVRNHPKRRNFIAAHPIAGTEYSGPESAFPGLYVDKTMIVCEEEKSDASFVSEFIQLSSSVGMHIVKMDDEIHDRHLAYISHLSHITSYTLSNTVLEKEKEGEIILELAGSGFESTVRLAKSSPEMWTPIFLENRKMVLESIEEYLIQLTRLKSAIQEKDAKQIQSFLEEGRKINKILKS